MHRQSILIVDDMPINIQVLARALKDDYTIKIATNGEKALEIVAMADPPDIILLDIMMPDMDGYEICRRLKDNPATINIPIIFVTAKTDTEDEMLGLQLGAVDYISKPFVMPIVKARVRTHLNLKRKSDILERRSLIDPLTEIPNRRSFEETLLSEWNRAREEASIAVLIIDVDFFKKFNDQYGHLEGDECLRKIANTLTASLSRSGDFVGRYGGEEFVVLLPQMDFKGTTAVAEKLRERVASLKIPHVGNEIADFVTVSVGGAITIPQKSTDRTFLLSAADLMLYEAKRSGRNCIKIQTV